MKVSAKIAVYTAAMAATVLQAWMALLIAFWCYLQYLAYCIQSDL